MYERDVWYIHLKHVDNTGIGECAPLPGLSIDDFSHLELKLDEVCNSPKMFVEDLSLLKKFPAICFALESAYLDLSNDDALQYFPSNSKLSIDINGLIWMGSVSFMLQQIEHKITEGYKCIKLKIGALDFDLELRVLQTIRSNFNKDEIQLRVDANGAFNKNNAQKRLEKLAKLDIHSIEQPIKTGQWQLLAKLNNIMPVALDEELTTLIDEKQRLGMLEVAKPEFIVLKPSLLGGFGECDKWIAIAKKMNISWWVTSALESNIGLNAIAQWTFNSNAQGFQGLGTGKLFNNNIPVALAIKNGKLIKKNEPIWRDINSFIRKWLSSAKNINLQTSGSCGQPKIISAQKKYLTASAKLSAKTFNLKSGDTVLLCLPVEYIAGKMMLVRAIELGLELEVVEPSIKPLTNIKGIIDFVAMSPLQLENSLDDLCKTRTIIVGGAVLSRSLIAKIEQIRGNYRQKTFPKIYETYGMTETFSHVAIKALNGVEDSFTALDKVRFAKNDRDCLIIHAPKLNEQPIITNDLVELSDETSFKLLGRLDNVINSGGIKIIPEMVETKLSSVITNNNFFITGLEDEVLGQKVVLIVEGEKFKLNFEKLEKYEKPKACYFIDKFIKTKTGKLNRKKTIELMEIPVF